MAEGTDCACCRKGVLLEGKRTTFFLHPCQNTLFQGKKRRKTRFFHIFRKILFKTFGGYRKMLYLCTRFKELSNTAKDES